MRVIEPSRDLDLAMEAIGADVDGEMRMEDLDGDRAAVLQVVREIDRGHAATADLTLDAIATRKRFPWRGLRYRSWMAHCGH